MDTPKMPLTWIEKLAALEVGKCHPDPIDKESSVYTAINAGFRTSTDPQMRSRKFSIRTDEKTNAKYAWRIK